MKTKNTTDFSAYIHETGTSNKDLVSTKEAYHGKHQNKDKSIHRETAFPLECPKCNSSDYKKNGKIKGSNRQRYKCNCSKGFSLSAKVVNIETLFENLYDAQHDEQPYMLSTKDRKIHSSKTDKRYTRFFDDRLKELEFEGQHTQDEVIAIAFEETNLYVDKLEERLLSKQKDTFFFFLNYSQADVAYRTEYEHYKLVRNHDINNYSQNTYFPLFYCGSCESSNLGRYGTNNNGRSRLECKTCGDIFVIRLKNLITKPYFIKTFTEMFNEAVPNYKLVNELAQQMYHDFFHTKFYDFFEKLIYVVHLITHRMRHYIMKLFVKLQHLRYGVHMTKYANRHLLFKNRKVTNIKYFSIIKDLSFLENDGDTIDKVLGMHAQYKLLVPELFNQNQLLDGAVQDSIYNTNQYGKIERK